MAISRSPSPRPPPPPSGHRSRKHRDRGYDLPREKSVRRSRPDITLLLCSFNSTSHNWHTAPLRFNPNRTNDRELWLDIRDTFKNEVRKPWKRLLSFTRVTSIVPVSFSPNGVPLRTDPKDFPDSKQFKHAYHHPEEIRPDHFWVDWFTEFDAGDKRQNGLEFVEGLWADKLAVVSVLASVVIVVISIVWCVLGGNLQTVFTVMSFVLTLVAAEIALAALYYQIALSQNN